MVDGRAAGVVTGCRVMHNILVGWEYQFSRTQVEIHDNLIPYPFNPSGFISNSRVDDNQASLSLVDIPRTDCQSNTGYYPTFESPATNLAPINIAHQGNLSITPLVTTGINWSGVYIDGRRMIMSREARERFGDYAQDMIEEHARNYDAQNGGISEELPVPTEQILASIPELAPILPTFMNTNHFQDGSTSEPIERQRINPTGRKGKRFRRPRPMFPLQRMELVDQQLTAKPLGSSHVHYGWREVRLESGENYFVCSCGDKPFSYGYCQEKGNVGNCVNFIPSEFIDLARESIKRRVIVAMDPDAIMREYSCLYSSDELNEAIALTFFGGPVGTIKYRDVIDSVLKEFDYTIRDKSGVVNCACSSGRKFEVSCQKGWRLKGLTRGGFSVNKGNSRSIENINSPSWVGGLLGITSNLTPIITVDAHDELVSSVAISIKHEDANRCPGYLKDLSKFHPGALGL
jgi:hypothetical protein